MDQQSRGLGHQGRHTDTCQKRAGALAPAPKNLFAAYVYGSYYGPTVGQSLFSSGTQQETITKNQDRRRLIRQFRYKPEETSSLCCRTPSIRSR